MPGEGGFGGFGGGGGGSSDPGPPDSPLVARLRKKRRVAFEQIRRRRRVLAPIGAAAQQPIQQTIVPRVGMSHDPWKVSVRVASTANVVIATGLEAGDSIDGVTLAAGDRVLLKNQSDLKENGIYVASTSGAGTRASDAVSGEHMVSAVVRVQQGSTNGNHIFVCFTAPPIVIGSSNLAWTDLGTFLGSLNGDAITDGTVPVSKLFGSGLSVGAMLYCDGSSWLVLEPPGVASVLKHDGTAPFWEAV